MAAVDQNSSGTGGATLSTSASEQGLLLQSIDPDLPPPPPPPPPRQPAPMPAMADPSLDPNQRRHPTSSLHAAITTAAAAELSAEVVERQQPTSGLRRQVGLLHHHHHSSPLPTPAAAMAAAAGLDADALGHACAGRQRTGSAIGGTMTTTTTSSTQLEFTQAMRDFKTMFPEMDDDVIEVVLRANQGAVDATIDQLLAMSTDNENERLRTEIDASENAEAPPGYSPVTPPPTYQQAVPASMSTGHQYQQPRLSSSSSVGGAAAAAAAVAATHVDSIKTSDASSATNGVPLRIVKNWRPPMLGPLPNDFLRIAGQWETSINARRFAAACRGRRSLTQDDRAHRQQSGGDADASTTGHCASSGTNASVTVAAATTTTLCSEVIQQKIEENERQRRRLSAATGDGDPELARCLEDERIALYLQNEEFVSELRANTEFLSTLERENSDSDNERQADEPKPGSKGNAAAAAATVDVESEAAFREKLTNMGKKSKRKFAQLARLFSRQKKRGVKQAHPYARFGDGGMGSMPSRDHLLLEDNDDDDEDNVDGECSDDDAAANAAARGRPLNEYHSFKNSSSPNLQRCNSGAT